MSAAAKDVRASQDKAALDALAGPAMAAMVLPTTMMMSGFVAAWGVGMAFARAFSVSANEAAARSTTPAARLVVSNPESAVEAAKPAPAKPTGTPPKPSTPGGTPPKPKSAKSVSPKDAPAKPKVVSPKEAAPAAKVVEVKPPVAEVPVAEAAVAKPVDAKPVAAKPVAKASAKPAGTDAMSAGSAAAAPKAKSAVASKAKAAAPAAKTTKVVPIAAKPMTIRTTSTAKGISLPKLSIQDKPDGKTGKD
ncbi:hypothetical protein [Phreatobacter sp.]|uniref:hypothetical protein n=1 Tax=Phreatobacter sp. TaxID=1966341 RepID=UPI0022C40453|nr:hypothetical protein [Phreatobacter sp.]MCZ8315063.1 hypothetical protein [Phreatobacter sp.]